MISQCLRSRKRLLNYSTGVSKAPSTVGIVVYIRTYYTARLGCLLRAIPIEIDDDDDEAAEAATGRTA